MNTKHKKPTLTKKQRHKLRVQQVRRQKIFLTCLFLLIVGCILLRFPDFPAGRRKPIRSMQPVKLIAMRFPAKQHNMICPTM